MELKRYVLLIESNEIMVVGVDIVERKWKEKGKFYGEMVEKSEMRVIADKWNYPLKDLLYKTSDNILDLVDEFDLVEYKLPSQFSHSIKIDFVRPTKKPNDGFVNLQNASVPYDSVIAIYKRQTNGDYKRYEVKE